MKTYARRFIGMVMCLTLVLGLWGPPPAHPTAAAAPPAAGGPTIRLAGGSFDPLAQGTSAPAQGLYLAAFPGDGTGYYLVQFSGPITPENVSALKAAGAEVFDYIPDFAFVVKMNAAARTRVAALSGVRWVGLHQPAYRLAPDLRLHVMETQPAPQAAGAHPSANLTPDATPLTLAVSVFRGESLTAVAARVAALGGAVLDQSETAWQGKLKVTLPAAALADLAALPGVRWIEAAPQWQLYNDKADNVMGVREVWDTHGLYGAGQTVAVCDTGLDQGLTSPASLHDDFENGAGASRVTAIFDRAGDGANDVNSGHGTHVAGSVLGNGALSGATPTAHTYPESAYVGMAPEANLVFQAVENNSAETLSGIPNDLNELFAEAAGGGADLHTNSWGSDVGGAYTGDSEAVDQYMWDHQDFAILFAASNAGVDDDGNGVVDLYSLGSPASAKNCITVGASENHRPNIVATWGQVWPNDFPASPVNDDPMADDPAGLAAFSSRGPTWDGRYKPDIVAPGSFVASTRSSQAAGSGWGLISTNSNYMYMGGTSMATPLAAGAVALIRQFYTDNQSLTPSAALLKATLLNGAADISPGQYGTGGTREIPTTRPTNVAGWGRVNIENSIFPTGTRVLTYTDDAAGLTTGQTRAYHYQINSSAEPLRVTLAWTDYPGSPASQGALVNDLDLQVEGPGGALYHSNNPGVVPNHLSYDDGMLKNYYRWGEGGRIAVRFTPTSYPATLEAGIFYLVTNDPDNPPDFNWYVYAGDNTSGPSTQMATGVSTLHGDGLHVIDLSDLGITIAGGDFFLAVDIPGDNLQWAFDDTAPIDQRSWDYINGTWVKFTTTDYMFQAIVSSGGAAQQDRVNNVEGIDLANPTPGIYTVTVSAYNAPQGPQPYALVASGDLRKPVSPPALAAIPDQLAPMNGSVPHAVDLWDYAHDDGGDAALTFSIVSQAPISAGVSLEANRYLNIHPLADFEGVADVTVQVADTDGLTDTETFQVTVTGDNIPPVMDLPAQNLAVNTTQTLNLWDYAIDLNDGVEVLTYTIVSVAPPGVTPLNFSADITGAHYLNLYAFTWTGTAYVTVRATDPDGLSATVPLTVTVVEGKTFIYLPLIMRWYPPVPFPTTLNAINNDDGDGNYSLSWTVAKLATTYQVQEATNEAFTGATSVYNGTATSVGISGKAAGIYYYRVRGQNSVGNGQWSGTQAATVQPKAPTLYAISNGDQDGNYMVNWLSNEPAAQSFTLQEDDDAAFSSPAAVYEGADATWTASGARMGGTYYYRVRANVAGLSSPWSNVQSVQVVIPTEFPAVADAYVLQGDPNKNFGSTIDMWAGYDDHLDPDGQVARSFIRFNLSAIPAAMPISNARLHIEYYNYWDYLGRWRTITSHRIASDWAESTVTWNTAPAIGETYGSVALLASDPSLGWYAIDVTALVQGWINGAWPNYGIALRGPEHSGPDSSWRLFSTRERGYPAYLQITYTGMTAAVEESAPIMPGEVYVLTDTLTSRRSVSLSTKNSICDYLGCVSDIP